MMRKFCFWILITSTILLMVSFSLAQSPRQPTSSEGKSTFTNIAVTGLDKDGTDGTITTGLPGYIEMVSTKGDTFYFYVGYDGKLRQASAAVVGQGASPSIVGWSDASGPIVGNQS